MKRLPGMPSFPVSKPVSLELWEGWFFENGLIYDDAGNHYSQRDIQLSFEAGRIVDDYYGKSHNILNLRQELERRKLLLTLPKIIFSYGSGEDYEEVVFDLVKNLDP